MSRIFSICVLKNEADIIEHCLQQALKWSERIILYDGDSTDGTWEIACRMAAADDRIIAWRQDGKPFQESLRAEVFNAFRHLASHGDWWCHLDADEFYIDDPRAFLSKVRRPYDVVWGLFIEYYLTQHDVDSLDFSQPMAALLPQIRHYRVQHSEPRFFRHRSRLVWSESEGWPRHMGLSYPKLIRFRHYKYRTPEQIQRRLATRQANIERGFPGWTNSKSETWRDKITSVDSLHCDQDACEFAVDSRDILRAHLGSTASRVLKYVAHGTGFWA
jgi:glycosyltransferase involved in cell wall biosynthesis